MAARTSPISRVVMLRPDRPWFGLSGGDFVA
jgi:hypothetical protein